MRVVLDTTALVADFRLTGNAFQILRGGLSRLPIRLIVPAVVVDEAVNKHRQQTEKLRRDAERLAKDLRRHLGRDVPQPEIHDIAERDAYELYLRETISEVGGVIAPYPSVAHAALVGWATEHRKPFSPNGAGYRDALVWHTVLDLLRSEPAIPLFLVTNNKDDFGGGPEPHPDLRGDLLGFGVDAAIFRIFQTVDAFNTEQVKPALEPLDDLKRRLQDDTVDQFSLMTWVQEHLRESLTSEDAFIMSPLDAGSASVDEVTGVHKLVVDDVRVLPPDAYLVTATADVDLLLAIEADGQDWFNSAEVQHHFPGSGGAQVLSDTEVVRVKIAFDIVIERADFAVTSFKAHSFQGRSGLLWLTDPLLPRRRR